MKVLVALAARPGDVLSRDELIDLCWDGRIVGDDVINRAILLLRGVAGRLGGFQIETIRKSGYRLLVDELPVGSRGSLIAGLALALAAALTGALWLHASTRHPGGQILTIEVMPFSASGGREAAGLASASTAIVADVLADSGITVVRPGLAAVERPPINFRMSGQTRVVGDQVEATIQVDDLEHGTMLLSRRFESNLADSANLPARIGAFAATSLATTEALMAVDLDRTGDPRMTGELLRYQSMLFVHEDTLRTHQAVDGIAAHMPNSALAQLGLAMSTPHALTMLPPDARPQALAKARAASARAHRLIPAFGDTYWPDCNLYSPVRFDQCERAARWAVKIDGTSPFAAANLRNFLVRVGRNREALTFDRMAVAAMPYMPGRLAASTGLLEALGQTQQAQQQFDPNVRWWPGFQLAYVLRVEGMLDRGDLDGAARFASAMPRAIDRVDRVGLAALARAVEAKRGSDVTAVCGSAALDRRLVYPCVVALTKVGEHRTAIAILDRIFPQMVGADRDEEDRLFLANIGGFSLGMLSAPSLAPLRNEARFLTIAQKVGLTAYWRRKAPDFCTFDKEAVCRAIRVKPPA